MTSACRALEEVVREEYYKVLEEYEAEFGAIDSTPKLPERDAEFLKMINDLNAVVQKKIQESPYLEEMVAVDELLANCPVRSRACKALRIKANEVKLNIIADIAAEVGFDGVVTREGEGIIGSVEAWKAPEYEMDPGSRMVENSSQIMVRITPASVDIGGYVSFGSPQPESRTDGIRVEFMRPESLHEFGFDSETGELTWRYFSATYEFQVDSEGTKYIYNNRDELVIPDKNLKLARYLDLKKKVDQAKAEMDACATDPEIEPFLTGSVSTDTAPEWIKSSGSSQRQTTGESSGSGAQKGD